MDQDYSAYTYQVFKIYHYIKTTERNMSQDKHYRCKRYSLFLVLWNEIYVPSFDQLID